MCHRSGLEREPPVGNDFDPTEPSLDLTLYALETGKPVDYKDWQQDPIGNVPFDRVMPSAWGHLLSRVAGEKAPAVRR